MSLFLIFKARGFFYAGVGLGKDCATFSGAPETKDSPIKRIGDITMFFQGSPEIIEAIGNDIDFSTLTEKILCESSLYHGFYLPLAAYILEHHLLEKNADGTIPDFHCEAIFISKDVAFTFTKEGFHQVHNMAAIGEGKEMALSCLKAVYTGTAPQQDIKKALINAGAFLKVPVYPILLPDFNYNMINVVPEKGEAQWIDTPVFSKNDSHQIGPTCQSFAKA